MKHVLYISFFVLFSFHSLWGQKAVSLEELLDISNRKALGIKIIKNELELLKSDYKLFQANRGILTSIQANLPNFYQSTSRVVQPDGNVLFKNITQNSASLGFNMDKHIISTNTRVFFQSNLFRFDNLVNQSTNYNTVPVRLGIQQGINTFNMDKWKKRLFPKKLKVQEMQATQSILYHQVEVVYHFFNVLKAQSEKNIALANVSNNQIILEIAKKRYDLGQLSLNDLTQIELNGVISEQSQINAQKTYNQALFALQKLTNHFEDYEITENFQIPNINSEILKSNMQSAWEKHVDNAAYEMKQLEIKQENERIKKQFIIQGNLSSSVGLVKSSESYREAYSNPQPELFLNLQVQMPIFQSKRKKYSLEKIQLQSKLNQDKKDYQEQTFKHQFQQLLTQIETTKNELLKSKEIVHLAEKAFEIANERFKLGNISTTDLILANNNRDFAKRNHINTLSNYWQLYYTLRALSGLDLDSGDTIKLIKLGQ